MSVKSLFIRLKTFFKSRKRGVDLTMGGSLIDRQSGREVEIE
jgi:hypothetical protein